MTPNDPLALARSLNTADVDELLLFATDAVEALERIETEAVGMGAEQCPPAPHACPKCEILGLAREVLATLKVRPT